MWFRQTRLLVLSDYWMIGVLWGWKLAIGMSNVAACQSLRHGLTLWRIIVCHRQGKVMSEFSVHYAFILLNTLIFKTFSVFFIKVKLLHFKSVSAYYDLAGNIHTIWQLDFVPLMDLFCKYLDNELLKFLRAHDLRSFL